MLCATTGRFVGVTPAKLPRWVPRHRVTNRHGVAVGDHVVHRPHEVGERVAIRGDNGEIRVAPVLLLPTEVHDDVRAEELLRQAVVAGGHELTGESLHDALVRLRVTAVPPYPTVASS